MLFETELPEPTPYRAAVRAAYRMDETACVEQRLAEAALAPEAIERIEATARRLVARVRRERVRAGGIDAFLHEYELSSDEGVVLMCLAEALLRIPDAGTADQLITDKIGAADWRQHLGRSGSIFVNASTWALLLTGRVVAMDEPSGRRDWQAVLRRLVARLGAPVIRRAVTQAMRIMGRQFVMGRTIGDALARARPMEQRGYAYSYDMLGEAARTMADADRYFEAYAEAVGAIGHIAARLGGASGEARAGRGVIEGPGVSVKLSALHPRYEFAQSERVMRELLPRLKRLSLMSKAVDIGLTIDAEEADRLDVSLNLIEAVSGDAELAGWDGLGLAVQAYQKRAAPVIDWLADMARRHRRRLMLRLVKGAYWDSEIKLTQLAGLDAYPVFTRKASTDVSYIACAKKLRQAADALYPMFATHNAHTVATILELAGDDRDFEFQRLHGMGEALYDQIVGSRGMGHRCRVYGPVGEHEDLLPYLARRLLENGANTSFVNRIVDRNTPIAEVVADPIARVAALPAKPHPRIPLPADLFGAPRRNSRGLDLSDPAVLAPLKLAMEQAAAQAWRARPLGEGITASGPEREVRDPADRRRVVGRVVEATPELALSALAAAGRAQPGWDATPVAARAAVLERTAELYETHRAELMALAVREAGKTIPDALAEVREAVDFLRYYAARARIDLGAGDEPAPGAPRLEPFVGRGVFACISPWNFPLAIFTGQVAAALAAGNAVLAKPAEQTPLMAAGAVRLMHEAGVPADVLYLLPGDGAAVGGALVADPRIGGAAFTGSTATARAIYRALAGRDGPLVPLIAETGGQNAMIVDSSALPEQVTRDVLASAFQSAGQRCSALRVLFLQEDVAGKLLDMLTGAMAELRVGDPALMSTDVGPVIDADAKAMLEAHATRMAGEGRLLYQTPVEAVPEEGTYFAPRAYEIDSIDRLHREVFGPILHVVRYRADRLDAVIDAINRTGYGLTFGMHSRIDSAVRHVLGRVHIGNSYVNRNQIGAVVGVQPFGGEGLSGTGPKAGGPDYLYRFVAERGLPAAFAADRTQPTDAALARRLDEALERAGALEPVIEATPEAAGRALERARRAQPSWEARPAPTRAGSLERAAELFETHAPELQALLVREAGMSRGEAIGEVDQALALLRRFAAGAKETFSAPEVLPGPTGERNEIALCGRGVFLCITSGRSPLAAFTGQVAAALAAGNAVLAKPAQDAARIAARAVRLIHQAGVPPEVLHLVPGDGAGLGVTLVADRRIDGVAFSGSAETALAINRALAARDGPIVPFVARIADAAGPTGAVPSSGARRYLHRYATERTVSVDTTAAGGNAALMAMQETPRALA
ncbi:MAG: bifunctional proline dehydrogenase/L-glutamate gamma-semialdehyde dehydrogenase PutA [Kiloniellales bacterium]